MQNIYVSASSQILEPDRQSGIFPLRVITPYILCITRKVTIHAKTAGSMRDWHVLDTESHAITNAEAVQSYSSSLSPPASNLGYDEDLMTFKLLCTDNLVSFLLH